MHAFFQENPAKFNFVFSSPAAKCSVQLSVSCIVRAWLQGPQCARVFKHTLLLLLDTPGKQPDQLAPDTGLDGSVRQDLPIAGPAAVGSAVVAGCLAGAYGTEACLLWTLAEVF